jgi:ectoine hydroxylase-related dioxygenase (phytanoyl-CoA dioxygenase family)
MLKQIFRNEIFQERFERNGYVVIQFVNQLQLEKLKELFHAYCPDMSHEDSAVFYSLFANDTKRNCELRNKIREIWFESYERLFFNYQPFAESFLAKGKTDEQLMLHQDWNYTEEEKHFSATVWCPLADTNTENGTLFVLPGSHHFFQTFRSGTLPSSRIAADQALEPYVVPVNVKAGEAVIFQQGLFHGSYRNRTKDVRVVAASIILEENKPATYYHQVNSDEVEIYEMKDDVFFEEIADLSAMKKPKKGVLRSKVNYHHRQFTEEDLLTKLSSKEILV